MRTAVWRCCVGIGLAVVSALGLAGGALAAALPAQAGSNSVASLSSVSCASPGDCTAVGSYAGSSGRGQGLLLTETAGTWATGVEASLPANAGSNPNVSLSSVSCASPGDCTAVGSYGSGQGLLLTEAGGVWATGIEAALPANAGSKPFVSLSSVSCASAGDCTAVGTYEDGSANVQGLLLSERSGTWATGVQASLPANAGSDPDVSLSSVSCASAGDCTAVGHYLVGPGSEQGLLLSESSGTWAAGMQAALPANAAPTQGPSRSNPSGLYLASVSCASAGDCSAVGAYIDSSGNSQGLLLSESSRTWATGVEASLPTNASSYFFDLRSVSCASAGDCSAVGRYTDSSRNGHVLLLSESSGTWATGIEATLPANAAGRPHVSGALLSSKSFKAKRGTKLKLTLSAAAKVRVLITRSGHKVKGACKANAKKGTKCQVKVKTLTFTGVAGANRFKLKLTGLKPGSYTAIVTASNSSGTSRKTKLEFKITH